MDKFLHKVEGDFSFAAFSPSFADKFTRLVNDNGADDELASAIAWVMENIPQTSLAAGNSSVLSSSALTGLH